MDITYSDTHQLSRDDPEALFLSVEWSSGHYPDKLQTAMEHFETVPPGTAIRWPGWCALRTAAS